MLNERLVKQVTGGLAMGFQAIGFSPANLDNTVKATSVPSPEMTGNVTTEWRPDAFPIGTRGRFHST